jgi:hypothetical protein
MGILVEFGNQSTLFAPAGFTLSILGSCAELCTSSHSTCDVNGVCVCEAGFMGSNCQFNLLLIAEVTGSLALFLTLILCFYSCLRMAVVARSSPTASATASAPVSAPQSEHLLKTDLGEADPGEQ